MVLNSETWKNGGHFVTFYAQYFLHNKLSQSETIKNLFQTKLNQSDALITNLQPVIDVNKYVLPISSVSIKLKL